jgi:hypothetical protein
MMASRKRFSSFFWSNVVLTGSGCFAFTLFFFFLNCVMSSAILLLLFVLDGACGVIFDIFILDGRWWD